MKSNRFLLFSLAALSLQCSTAPEAKKDLKALGWIEGNWRGMDGSTPFYEIYDLIDDTTLAITSYEWNGKDSSKSLVAYLKPKEGAFYLGDDFNWKVTAISDTSIFMKPVFRAANSILWKKKDSNSWEAVLETKKGKTVYQMERINHFPKS